MVEAAASNRFAAASNLASRNDFVLIIGWLLAALRARGPYPLLAISGEQGSAKTALSKLLKALIDPNAAAHGRTSDHPPTIGSDVDGAPVLIGEIEIEVPVMLGCTDMDGPLQAVNSARASSRSSADLISAALAAAPVAR